MKKFDSWVRYNNMSITSLHSFVNIKGGVHNGQKDVYFIRCIGHSQMFLEEIASADRILMEREALGMGGYQRLLGLPILNQPEEIAYYRTAYQLWIQTNQKNVSLKSTKGSAWLEARIGLAVAQTAELLTAYSEHINQTITENFVLKLLFWLDQTAGSFFLNWDEKKTNKVICTGISKKQEYLFLFLLTAIGIDVMILSPSGELPLEDHLLQLSDKLTMDQYSDLQIPPLCKEAFSSSRSQSQDNAPVVRISMEKIRKNRTTIGGAEVSIPDRSQISGREVVPAAGRNPAGSQSRGVQIAHPNRVGNTETVPSRREKTYEELALCASSMVMIEIHNQVGKLVGTGSGIMINQDGYLLTNNHVTQGGAYYSVRIEDDENLYETDELIKCNAHFDLSIIRISRRCRPIPIYRGGEKLVRGQRVVAIGSPLGMFNTVSDGIISGFRTIDYVDMIQFTAPISHGSSGGALLNLYGEVIGISTAGFDSGQNLNLAVHYQYLNDFVRGFVS